MLENLFDESFNDEDGEIPHLFNKNIKNSNFHLKFPDWQRKNCIEAFLKLKSEFESYRIRIIKETSHLLKQIHKTTSETLKTIQIYSKNLDEIISQIVNWEQMDQKKINRPMAMLLELPKISISQFKQIILPKCIINRIDLNVIKKMYSINQWNFQDESKNFKSYSLSFFRGITQLVTIFDAKRVKITDSKFMPPQEIDHRAAKCSLPFGKLFFHSKDECFILYPYNYVRSIPAYKSSFLKASAIYIDGFVYLFSGISRNSAKININSEKWSSLSDVPFEFGKYSTCAQFKNYILLSSWESTNIFYYDISIDSYSEIPLNGLEKVIKAIFVKNDKAFLLEFPRFIYESDENLMVWNKVGNIQLMLYAPVTSHSIEYKGNFYFANLYGVYSFSLKEKIVKRVLAC